MRDLTVHEGIIPANLVADELAKITLDGVGEDSVSGRKIEPTVAANHCKRAL